MAHSPVGGLIPVQSILLSVDSSRSLKHYHGYTDFMQKIKHHGLFQFQGLNQSTKMIYGQNKDITLKETQYIQSGAMLFKQAPYAVAS